jgi:predicted HicB family RNase H-like nuclease
VWRGVGEAFGCRAHPAGCIVELFSDEETMSTLNLRLPESIHKGARESADEISIGVNQLAATPLAETLATLGSAA